MTHFKKKQGVPEVLKQFCFPHAAIVVHRLRQTGYQTKANGRKFCILMCGTMSVQSPTLGVMEKRAREIKLSITLSSAVTLILPISSVIFSFRSASAWDVLSNTLSFNKQLDGGHARSHPVILAVTRLYHICRRHDLRQSVQSLSYVPQSRAVSQASPAALKPIFSAILIPHLCFNLLSDLRWPGAYAG